MAPIKLKTFDDCIRLTGQEKKHVLLGNGFSIACRKDIFSYTSLYNSANFSCYSEKLHSLFGELGTTDFEVVMDALEKASIALKHYDGKQKDTIRKFQDDYKALRKLLVETLTKHHPIRPDDISDDEYESCKGFLSHFERIYTLNYDLLLYWTLMKIEPQKDDGFRDPYVGDPEEYVEEDYVAWVNNTYSQIVFYMHGALHLFMSEFELKKYCWSRTGIKLLEQIDSALKEGHFPLVVSESESDKKMAKIQRNAYLGHAYRSIASIGHNLFIYGHSLADNDKHILDQISKNKSLTRVFISIYGEQNSEANRRIIAQGQALKEYRGRETRKEIFFFDAASAQVWSRALECK